MLPMLPRQVVVCGGGVYNRTLMTMLQRKFKHGLIIDANTLGLNADAIEAQLMAYLAARFFENLPSSFPTSTGVKYPTIAGEVFMP